MRKHMVTLAALLLALAFVAVFFSGRKESKPLETVARQVGLKAEDLVAMVPRVSSRSGATVGTSRRLVYLMACSGVPTGATLEAQATLAAGMAEKRGMTPREAAKAVLATSSVGDGATHLADC